MRGIIATLLAAVMSFTLLGGCSTMQGANPGHAGGMSQSSYDSGSDGGGGGSGY